MPNPHFAVVVESEEGYTHFELWENAALVRRTFARRWTDWELIDILRAPPGPYSLVRPSDLTVLTVQGQFLRERIGENGIAEWIADGDRPQLIVELPPQHLAETVFGSARPSQARLAGRSRLHFDVSARPVPLSAKGVLHAMGNFLLASSHPPVEMTALELPWRLILMPRSKSKCLHREVPASSAEGVTEIWHTHLIGSDGKPAAVYPINSLPLEQPFAQHTPLSEKVEAIARAGRDFPETQVDVDRLILSACGAWFSGSVRYPSLEWVHKAAMGRDYYVRIVQQGVMYPFGHRGAVVEQSERVFSVDGQTSAVIRKSFTLIISEPSKQYDAGTLDSRCFPFQRIDLEPRILSRVDRPDNPSLFWPKVDGKPVVFTVHGTAGSEVVTMNLPLLFSDGTNPERLDEVFSRGPDGTGVRPKTIVAKPIPLAMKTGRDALEESVQHVHSLTFGGKRIAGGNGFYPRIEQLEVELPAVNHLLGPIRPVPAKLSNQLLGWVPGADPPDVLLDLTTGQRLNFGSAKSGVVASPNFVVDQISRSKGPTTGFQPERPEDLFKADAQLLGVIPLKSIIQQITGPPVIKWTEGPHPMATLDWSNELKAPSNDEATFVPEAGSRVSLTVVSGMSGGRPSVSTDGKVTCFSVHIPKLRDALVTLTFNTLAFQVETGGLIKPVIDLKSVSLGGKLAFVQKLSKHMPQLGQGGPAIEVDTEKIKVTYTVAVPGSVELGVFSLKNLFMEAGVTLSFLNQPVTIDFAFGKSTSPFLVTVSGFGGGGYLELGIGAGGQDGGLQRLVGGIEFGASVGMNFGIAAGEVHVFGGVVFSKKGKEIEIAGYLRIGGMVRVLGLISVSIELTVSLTYAATSNELRGSAKLVIAIDLTFWSTSVEIECEKCFKGSALTLADAEIPRLSIAETYGPVGESFPWRTLCRAFAGEQ